MCVLFFFFFRYTRGLKIGEYRYPRIFSLVSHTFRQNVFANLRSKRWKNETTSKRLRNILRVRILGLHCGKQKKNHILGQANRILKLAQAGDVGLTACFKMLKNSDLGVRKGCLLLALKCCWGQRLLYLICKSKHRL